MGLSSTVFLQLVRAANQIKVAIMSFDQQNFAMIPHVQEHCGFGSTFSKNRIFLPESNLLPV